MNTWPILGAAAVCEIAGWFAFWMWLRLGHTWLWSLAGTAALVLFTTLLTWVDTAAAGRAFAAYGGVYVAASLLWLWAVEGIQPDRWDALGGAICLAGACVILFGPRAA